ncbi:hypothetical protein AWB74_07739 [Caballeronia arvi]|uniref:Uncharacterized protein n=1 Tax=Caballeronia arvi TaxID=1777135 RepID=A0A158L0M0_9BURK|nr:hypothetical protein [Caballeronia arvi]SAL86523.1 hypothetical protein AWB74_07739 [Caballeronia arvi]
MGVAQCGIEATALDRLHFIRAWHVVGVTGGLRPACEQVETRCGGEIEMAASVEFHELSSRHAG